VRSDVQIISPRPIKKANFTVRFFLLQRLEAKSGHAVCLTAIPVGNKCDDRLKRLRLIRDFLYFEKKKIIVNVAVIINTPVNTIICDEFGFGISLVSIVF
jgi:hypothetical protein